MELILIALYALCFLFLWNSATLLALVLFCFSGLIVGGDFDHLIFAVIYAPFCFHNSNKIKLAALSIIIFQYLMAWDYALYPLERTPLFKIYPYASFMLNLMLIISIIRGSKDGFYNADDCWYNDLKFNSSRY